MKLADISQYQKLSDYLPIFTGTLIADLVIIFIFSYTMFKSDMIELSCTSIMPATLPRNRTSSISLFS